MFSRHVKIILRVSDFAVGINNMVTERGRGEGNSSSFFCVCVCVMQRTMMFRECP